MPDDILEAHLLADYYTVPEAAGLDKAALEAVAHAMVMTRIDGLSVALTDPYEYIERLRQQQGGRCTCGKCEHSR